MSTTATIAGDTRNFSDLDESWDIKATMHTNLAFWRHNATEFERLHDPIRPLCAEYDPAGHRVRVTGDTSAERLDPTDRWVLSGGSPGVIAEFKSLAGVAAVALECAVDAEASTHWLDCIRRQSDDYIAEGWIAVSASAWPLRGYGQAQACGPEDARDAEISPIPGGGQIADVCDASARFCRLLANELEKATLLPTSRDRHSSTPFGHRVARLRQECGWTYEKLAEHTGLGRSTVIGHVTTGSTPRVGTAKRYADAFTNALKRPISALDLMADSAQPDSD
jgi:DNA-binding XRE family transcriptional regulator